MYEIIGSQFIKINIIISYYVIIMNKKAGYMEIYVYYNYTYALCMHIYRNLYILCIIMLSTYIAIHIVLSYPF